MLKNYSRLSRQLACVVGVFASLSIMAGAQASEAYPSKPTRLVVGFSPGGPVDLGARVIGEQLTRSFGQAFIVENKPGANAMIAAQTVKHAEPDGSTVFVSSSSAITLNPTLFKKSIRYDPATDFRAVATIMEMPLILVVNATEPKMKNVHTLKDLIELAKKEPGNLAYGSAGVGNITQLAFELLSSRADIKLNHVPYKGTSSAQAAILGKEVLMVFDSISAIPHIKNGTLRPLAVSSSRRVEGLPDVPTVQELGYGDFDVASWVGLFVPKATPDAIVERLSKEVIKITQIPEVAQKLTIQGPILALGPDEFAKKVEKESAQLLSVIEVANIKLEE